MIDFVCTPPFLGIALRVAMVTMHFHMAQTGLFSGNIVFRILGIPGNKLAPMKNRPVGDAKYVKLDHGVYIKDWS